MGGAREQTVESPAAKGGKIKSIRFHENDGEIHFHDDKAKPKIKVAVPVADFWSAWEKFKGNPLHEPIQLFDLKNGTSVTINGVYTDDGVDASIALDKIKFGKTFSALDGFVQGK